ncbi:trafficking protein particle complex subunit 8 [Trichonephila inaurata madagascariensis]|uniref:Trafficking protein particle complex subunit 8 n=1 Tax=Trichonephila inaurata madagascariensis TaxID=2747483 RepID=A0A8X6X7E7_9ARAC|nr:trafficking protein particle complex subunit 8 [Trichonephila inaurata madagascariensis]
MILLLVIIWKAKVCRNGKDHIIIGLHHVPIHSLDPSTVELKTPSIEAEDIALESEESEIDQLQNIVPSDLAVTAMLKCSLKHPFEIQHNFSVKRIVIVPVEFIVRSTSDMDLNVVIDNLSHVESGGAFNTEDGYSHLVQRFTWVNGTKRELQVKPHCTVQISLQAMFCAPGTYNLEGRDVECDNFRKKMTISFVFILKFLTERKLEFSGGNAEGVYTQCEKKRKTMREKIKNQKEGANGMPGTSRTHKRPKTKWRRSGTNGGRSRKESIAKENHGGAERGDSQQLALSLIAVERLMLCEFKKFLT